MVIDALAFHEKFSSPSSIIQMSLGESLNQSSSIWGSLFDLVWWRVVKKEIFSVQWALILQAAIKATKQHDSFAEEWRIICKQEKRQFIYGILKWFYYNCERNHLKKYPCYFCSCVHVQLQTSPATIHIQPK